MTLKNGKVQDEKHEFPSKYFPENEKEKLF